MKQTAERMHAVTVTDVPAGDPAASAVRLFDAVQGHFELAADRIGLDEGARKVLSTHRREVAVSVRVGMDDGLEPATERDGKDDSG